jgi:hypothetical protein
MTIQITSDIGFLSKSNPPVTEHLKHETAQDLAQKVALMLLCKGENCLITPETIDSVENLLGIDLSVQYGMQEYNKLREQLLECPSMVDHTRQSTIACMQNWKALAPTIPQGKYYCDLADLNDDYTKEPIATSIRLENSAIFETSITLKKITVPFMLKHRLLNPTGTDAVQSDWIDYALLVGLNEFVYSKVKERIDALKRLDHHEHVIQNEWQGVRLYSHQLFQAYHPIVASTTEAILHRPDFFTFIGKHLDNSTSD